MFLLHWIGDLLAGLYKLAVASPLLREDQKTGTRSPYNQHLAKGALVLKSISVKH